VPDDGGMDVGVMTAPFQVDKVVDQIEDARTKGATIEVGGKRVGDSHCVQPTLITNVNDTMKVVTEETFGPVISVQKFTTDDEAIRMANDSEYGLSASVWSADIERADRIARKIDTGNVSINNVLATQANSALPYGGTKESGFGRYKGPHGLHAFSNIKSVLVDGTNQREVFWYPYSKEKYNLMSKMLDAIYDGGPLWLFKLLPIALKLQGMAKKSKF
jgi:acyl-CoA reductase-like NAD-dependent aldehyde dehydrogenase